MAISNNLIEEAIDVIANIQGIQMNQDELVDDVILVAFVFDEESTFKLAINQITNSIQHIVSQRNVGQALVNTYDGWMSFHFQSQRVNGHPADLRVVYQNTNTVIRIHGFGHRHLPTNIYRRLNGR
ncbi:hypothetical protein [Paenisporosarcina sp. TG20]|uniref:hypothetical protein n=1 Tax=Paenisporosarcina sp. TG20 TaxID=1211706 RepID=UPI0002D3AA5B|nr:hypothetical protein [Paenisporosarcina sp. TG20]